MSPCKLDVANAIAALRFLKTECGIIGFEALILQRINPHNPAAPVQSGTSVCQEVQG
jgi:hypothetical protein